MEIATIKNENDVHTVNRLNRHIANEYESEFELKTVFSWNRMCSYFFTPFYLFASLSRVSPSLFVNRFYSMKHLQQQNTQVALQNLSCEAEKKVHNILHKNDSKQKLFTSLSAIYTYKKRTERKPITLVWADQREKHCASQHTMYIHI